MATTGGSEPGYPRPDFWPMVAAGGISVVVCAGVAWFAPRLLGLFGDLLFWAALLWGSGSLWYTIRIIRLQGQSVGLFRAFTNKALIKQTAKWVVHHFDQLRSARPLWRDQQIIRYMLASRYSVGPDPLEDEQLRSLVWSDFAASPSLCTLLLSILVRERVVESDDAARLRWASDYLKRLATLRGIGPRASRMELDQANGGADEH